jgi:hypothetical protein
MKYDKSALGFLAGVALFAGFMVVTAGGPFFPSMHRLTAPLICRGTVETERHDYSYGPGHGGNYLEVYCRSDAGTREEITFRAVGLAWLAASALAFVALFAWLRKSAWLQESGRILDGPDEQALAAQLARQALAEKLARHAKLDKLNTELKKELGRGHISREEYEARRADLLKG